MTNEEKFWSRLIETEGGCWELPNKPSTNGYIQIRTAWRRNELSHRVAMEIHTGQPIPEGMEVEHTCRNRRCCNPDHLEIVTTTENNRRKEETVLTHELTEEIRLLYTAGDLTQSELAKRYGVSRGHISHVINWNYWRV